MGSVKKNILFCCFSLNLGGVETFITRLKESSGDLYNIKVLLMTNYSDEGLRLRFCCEDIYYLSEYTRFDFISFGRGILRSALPLKAKKIIADFDDIDIFHATCSFSLSLLNRFRACIGHGVLTAGVYHSKEYVWGDINELMRGEQMDLFKSLPSANVLFMNEYTVAEYRQRFLRHYYIILPIGVDILKYSDVAPDRSSNLIVSIGRLVNFKSYNSLMLEVLSVLRGLGHDYKYDIYGDGPEKSNLLSKIRVLGLEDSVRLMGGLDYSKMPEVLNKAFLFVGSGTAIVEASAAGVPSMIGIESSSDSLTYGLLTETVGNSFHEAGLNYPLKKYEHVILGLAAMTDSEYLQVSLDSRKRAEIFSTCNMKIVFSEFVENLVESEIDRKKYFPYLLGTYFWVLKCALGISSDKKTMHF